MDAAVNETKEILHKLLDNAGVMILYLDPHKNISFCNKKIEELRTVEQKINSIRSVKNEMERKLGRIEGMIEV